MWAAEPQMDFFVSFIDLAMHDVQLPQVKTALQDYASTRGVSFQVATDYLAAEFPSWRKPFGWQGPELGAPPPSRFDGFCGARPARGVCTHSTDCRLLTVFMQAAAESCEDPQARRLIDSRILSFMTGMIEDGLVGEALLDLDVENEIHMDRLEGLLARARLPDVFFADFKWALSLSPIILDVLGGAGASTSPTSTLEPPRAARRLGRLHRGRVQQHQLHVNSGYIGFNTQGSQCLEASRPLGRLHPRSTRAPCTRGSGFGLDLYTESERQEGANRNGKRTRSRHCV